jgi:hypothetical protein
MIQIKNHKQTHLFDPWGYVSPKRRTILDKSWAGLFQKEILPSLPVDKIGTCFHKTFGRPSKELYSVLGVLVLQQTFDLTDIETVEQFAFNLQWHYALNITEDSDRAKYMCPKTLWSMRSLVAKENLDEKIFNETTKKLIETFKVSTDTQRIDSTHIQSNMRRLGRICIFTETINTFLVNLKRQHKDQFAAVSQEVTDKYLTEKALSCFSRVKPSESRKTLEEVSKDLYQLVEQFKGCEAVSSMHSYKQLARVLEEQCNVSGSDDKQVEVKPPKEIPSSSLQNPSDPDASYSGHKGQGYQVQLMETYSTDEKKKQLSLVTYVHVEPAHNSDAHALIPAIESVKEHNLSPREVVADSLYGSDENAEKAKEQGVELIAPVMGTPPEGDLSLSDFTVSEKGEIVACPKGYAPAKIKEKKERISVAFHSQHCQNCPCQAQCPVEAGKRFYYLHYTKKDERIAQRRAYEKTKAFEERYRWRSGIEATFSKYARRTGVKRLRVRGLTAVRYCATLKAVAVNMFRAAAFQLTLDGEKQPGAAKSLCHFPIFLIVKEHFAALGQQICEKFFARSMKMFCMTLCG